MDRSLAHAFDAREVMAYLDGELEPHRAAALAGHLEHCGECQDVAKQLRLVAGRMLNFEIEAAPARLAAAVLAEPDSAARAEPAALRRRAGEILARWRELVVNRNVWAIAGGFAIAVAVMVGARQAADLARRPASEASLPVSAQPGAAEGSYPSYLPKDAADLQRSREAMISPNMMSATRASQQAAEPGPPAPPPPQSLVPEAIGPMIVQTASLGIVAKHYDEASDAMGRLVRARGGYIEKLDAKAQTGSARTLSAALRIPAKQLDGFLADLRGLGRVEQESQSNEEVSAEYVDLQARLRSAQATERRLIELLATRTGKLEDVLEVERELARIRGEIESMQGQSNLLLHRVSYATVQVDLSEEYHEKLASGASTGTKLRNAFIEGIHTLEDGIVGALIFLLNEGPAILFWLAVFGLPGWLIWRRRRSQSVTKA
jgi:Domain of unknown function (DUF4349)/Putative zinc-finger